MPIGVRPDKPDRAMPPAEKAPPGLNTLLGKVNSRLANQEKTLESHKELLAETQARMVKLEEGIASLKIQVDEIASYVHG
jgi:uncharacterized coiled-coil protein SlyX